LLPLRNAQRRFEGALALVNPVETEKRDTLEATKLRVPPTVACFILHRQPLSRRGKRSSVLALQCHRLGQADKPVGTKGHAGLAGKPRPQADDRLLERSLRAQRGATEELRWPRESEPLLRS